MGICWGLSSRLVGNCLDSVTPLGSLLMRTHFLLGWLVDRLTGATVPVFVSIIFLFFWPGWVSGPFPLSTLCRLFWPAWIFVGAKSEDHT